jgi:hypothetical protein
MHHINNVTRTCHYEVIQEKTISGGMANEYLLITEMRVWSVNGEIYARADAGETLYVCDSYFSGSYELVNHGGSS